ncbi:MAG: hypothetical protein ABJA35_15090 [Parafilimonas sp.]
MNDINSLAFIALFKNACEKCFTHKMVQALSETESKLFYNQVFEQTGLVIGWKSLKNYSAYILNPSHAKEENPSTASLDTLARYVLDAPYITEAERKNKESHYPYWFQYKEQWLKNKKPVQKKKPVKGFLIIAGLLFLVLMILLLFFSSKKDKNIAEDFHATSEDSLQAQGWVLQSKDEPYWNRRNEQKGMLSLFTLRGDNWHDSANEPGIKNFLLRKISSDCFTAEVHLQNFFPDKEWQQAGVLLLEDTAFKGKSLRLSLAYNDFFGGFSKPKEVIIQAITSPGNGLTRPEEIAHVPVFTLDSGKEDLVKNNLQFSALRIEKTGNQFRLLYSCSPSNNFAFKEAATTEFDMHPKYIGIFALKGFVNDTTVIPAGFTYFTITNNDCEK